jgi:hypothetical protein
MLRTRDLLHMRNTGHPGMNALFAKAHSADWDFERDVDWTIRVVADESLVDLEWTAFGATPTFRALPERAKAYVNRRALGRMLNILQVGESVAQNVCAKLVLLLEVEEHRNHAAAQAMDEARHHLAYRRFLEKMGEEVEDIDPGTEMTFDALLASNDPLDLIATEQFFLESLAMSIFDGIERSATNPLLGRILSLITRDESRHMGFGLLYLADWMKEHSLDDQISFARRWLGQILMAVADRPGPIFLARVLKRLRDIGIEDADALGPQMLEEQRAINQADLAAIAAGTRVPQLLKSARRVGMLRPEILEELRIADHPLVRGALRASVEN